MASTRIPLNKNNFSPNKFKVTMTRFPGVEYFVQSANLPGISMGTPQIPTNRYLDYYTIGDKLQYNDLNLSFLLDENLQTFREIHSWFVQIMKAKENISNILSDMDIILLTNNSKQNIVARIHGAFPYALTDINMSYQLSENSPILMDVTFKIIDYELISTS